MLYLQVWSKRKEIVKVSGFFSYFLLEVLWLPHHTLLSFIDLVSLAPIGISIPNPIICRCVCKVLNKSRGCNYGPKRNSVVGAQVSIYLPMKRYNGSVWLSLITPYPPRKALIWGLKIARNRSRSILFSDDRLRNPNLALRKVSTNLSWMAVLPILWSVYNQLCHPMQSHKWSPENVFCDDVIFQCWSLPS